MEPGHKSAPGFQCLLVSKQLLSPLLQGDRITNKTRSTWFVLPISFCAFWAGYRTRTNIFFYPACRVLYLIPSCSTNPRSSVQKPYRGYSALPRLGGNVPQSFPVALLCLDVTLRWIPKSTLTFPADPLRAGRQAENRVTNHRAPNKWHQHSLEMDCVFHPQAACGTCVPPYTSFHRRICPILWPAQHAHSVFWECGSENWFPPKDSCSKLTLAAYQV